MSKMKGAIVIDTNMCKGCGLCVVACPMKILELAPKKAAGTAAGFTGLFGYLGGSLVASAITGFILEKLSWDTYFILLIISCILAIFFIALTFGHKKTN